MGIRVMSSLRTTRLETACQWSSMTGPSWVLLSWAELITSSWAWMSFSEDIFDAVLKRLPTRGCSWLGSCGKMEGAATGTR